MAFGNPSNACHDHRKADLEWKLMVWRLMSKWHIGTRHLCHLMLYVQMTFWCLTSPQMTFCNMICFYLSLGWWHFGTLLVGKWQMAFAQIWSRYAPKDCYWMSKFAYLHSKRTKKGLNPIHKNCQLHWKFMLLWLYELWLALMLLEPIILGKAKKRNRSGCLVLWIWGKDVLLVDYRITPNVHDYLKFYVILTANILFIMPVAGFKP